MGIVQSVVKLDGSSKARAPTWVKSQREEKVFCRRCAVEFFITGSTNPSAKIIVNQKEVTVDSWRLDTTRRYSMKEVAEAYTLWKSYHGYKNFYIFSNFFKEIFSRAFRKCRAGK